MNIRLYHLTEASGYPEKSLLWPKSSSRVEMSNRWEESAAEMMSKQLILSICAHMWADDTFTIPSTYRKGLKKVNSFPVELYQNAQYIIFWGTWDKFIFLNCWENVFMEQVTSQSKNSIIIVWWYWTQKMVVKIVQVLQMLFGSIMILLCYLFKYLSILVYVQLYNIGIWKASYILERKI